MATYSTIKGFNVETIAGDPSNPVVGQVWYNSSSGTLKGYGAQGTGARAAGGLLNAMTMQMGTAGTQTAALSFGGTGDGGFKISTIIKNIEKDINNHKKQIESEKDLGDWIYTWMTDDEYKATKENK